MMFTINHRLRTIFYTISIVSIALFSACSKDTIKPKDPFEIDKSQTYLANDNVNKLRDSVWYYYKLLSLWQDVIPPTSNNEISQIDEIGFIRNNYTQYFKTPEDVLEYLKSLTKNKSPNRIPLKNYDWYSFIDNGSSISAEIQETLNSGLGLSVFFLQTDNSGTNAHLYIKAVDQGSSAFDAGLQRGDQIISINGDTKLDYDFQKGKNFEPLLSYLNANSIIIKVRKPSGETIEKNLFYKSFNSNPVQLRSVINIGSKKIGYFLFNSFASIKYRNAYTSFYNTLENLFAYFEQNGINELVIDLRNNGGGDVETAEYIANRIIPASLNGSTMYSYAINNTLKGWGWLNPGEEFAPVIFQKRGNLNLNRIYFLVSPNTASASELLINTLKPVIPTFMIGTYSVNDKGETIADRTYGKPVGFFGLPIDNTTEIYVTSFKMYNSKHEGDYYDGLVPNTNVWEFRNFYDFGNKDEAMLATAINHMQTGSFSSNSNKAALNIGNNNKIPKTKESLDLNNKNSGMFKFKNKNFNTK